MFVKLFRTLLQSTLWMEPDYVLRTFITMLLLADPRGVVKVSVPGLAHAARLELDEVRDALVRLEAPDPDSQSKTEEGRRLVRLDPVEPVWEIVNYLHYREMRDEETRRDASREYQRRWRAKVRGEGGALQSEGVRDGERSGEMARGPVGPHKPTLAQAEAEEEVLTPPTPPMGGEASAPPRRKPFAPPTESEVEFFLASIGESRFTAPEFISAYEARGWKMGKAGTPMVNWKGAVRQWAATRTRQGEPQPPPRPSTPPDSLEAAQARLRSRTAPSGGEV